MSAFWFAAGILTLIPLLIVQQHRIAELRRRRQELLDGEKCRLFVLELIEAIPCPIFCKTRDGRYLGCNRAFEEYLGRRREEIVGRTIHDVAPKELADQYAAADADLFARAGKQIYEVKVQRADGSLSDVVMHKATFPLADEAVGGIVGVIVDITDGRRTERDLQRSEQNFRTLAENLPDPIARYDREGRWVYLNCRLEEFLGIRACDVLGRTALLQNNSEQAAEYARCLARVLATGQPAEIDTAWELADNRISHHNIRFVVEHGPGGEVVGALAIGRDVTERRKAQRELELLNTAINKSNDGVFLMDDNLRFVQVNDTACQVLGYSREELLGMGPLDIDIDVTAEVVRTRAEVLSHRGTLPPFEARHRARNGRVFPVEIGGSLFDHEGRAFGLYVVREITERKRLEDALRFVAQRGWAEDGKSLFEALARYLAEVLGMEYAMVVRLGRTPGSAETVALVADGSVVPNIHYELADTPCNNVVNQDYCCYPRNVQRLFPDDALLTQMGAESYAGIPLWDSDGQPLGLIAVLGRDPMQNEGWVSQLLQLVAPRAAAELEHARSDDLLRAREHEFRRLAESSPDSVIRWDRAGYIRYVNSEMVRKLGIASADEVIGRLPASIWPDGRYAQIMVAFRRAIETKENVTIEFNVPQAAERHQVEEIRVVPELNEAGEVIGAIAFGRDITALKRYHETLSAREREFRSLAENAPDNIVRFDNRGRLLYLNPRLEKTLRMAAADVVGKMPQEIVPGWDMAPVNGVLETGEPVEIEFATPDAKGLLRLYQIRLVAEQGPQGDIISVLGIGRDVTRRKRIERDMLVLSKAINTATDGILLVSQKLQIRYVNDRICRTLGYSRSELLMKTPGDLVTREGLEKVAFIRSSLLGSESVVRAELQARAADGRIFSIELSASFVEYENEKLALVLARDITERKRMERALRAREEEFRSLAENLPDMVMRYDLQCRCIYVNPAFVGEVSAAEHEILGCVPNDLLWRSSRLSVDDYRVRLQRVMATGEPAEIVLDWKRASDGISAEYAVRVVAERDARGQVVGALCIAHNVTKLMESERRLEESRRQLRDFAARREDAREEERRHIAREIHDELGQQLSALRFKLGLLAYDFGAERPDIRGAVENLMSLVGKAIQTTREVSSALRPAVLDMGILPALEWLVSEYAAHGGVSFATTAKPEEVRMNSACTVALFRIVQESLTNAIRHSRADRIEVVLARQADTYVLQVRDNGIGFDPEAPRDLRSVGLLGMRERALAIGGEWMLFSAVGQGTALQVRIPAGEDQEGGS